MSELIDRQNWLDVQKFLKALEMNGQLSQKSIDRYQSYLRHLLFWAKDQPLWKPDNIYPGLVNYLKEYISPKTGKPLSREAWRKILGITGQFYDWASLTLRRYSYNTRSFGINLKIPVSIPDERNRDYITYEEALEITRLDIDPTNLALRRDQAIACLLLLTGMRASAAVSIPIFAIDPGSMKIIQDPSDGVKTKNSKKIRSRIFPIPKIYDRVVEWHEFISTELPNTFPWYPVIDQNWGLQEFSLKAPGSNRNQTLNKRLRNLAKQAGINYHSAHNFRRGHVVIVGYFATGYGDFKLLSQHLGHSNIMITEQYYNQLSKIDLDRRMNKFLEKFKAVTTSNYQPD